MTQHSPKKIAYICHNGIQALDLFGPLEVFSKSTYQQNGYKKPHYENHIFSSNGGSITTSSGVVIETKAFKSLSGFDSLVVVGGSEIYKAAEDPNFYSIYSNFCDSS